MSTSLTEQLCHVPQDKAIDSTIAFLNEGYRFIPNRMERYHSYIFETRLFFQKAVCLRGPEAAEMFYDAEYFKRENALPLRVQLTLTGRKAVQTLDGDAHEWRKALFMRFMHEKSLRRLQDLFQTYWQEYFFQARPGEAISLFESSQAVLYRTACAWMGIESAKADTRSRQMMEMVYAFGGAGPRFLRGVIARQCAERWMASVIERIRKNPASAAENSIIHAVALFRGTNDSLLDVKIAAIEALNFLRPITAIATWITFSALALHRFGKDLSLERLRHDENYLQCFVQEVRRYYPFTPYVGARAKKDFIWQGYPFRRNQMVLLDVYGANHDESLWSNPSRFNPERFSQRELQKNPFLFIPQGGGTYSHHHRCAGDQLTVNIMKEAVRQLLLLHYHVPSQDLDYPLTRIPTAPRSGLIITL